MVTWVGPVRFSIMVGLQVGYLTWLPENNIFCRWMMMDGLYATDLEPKKAHLWNRRGDFQNEARFLETTHCIE